MAKDGNRSSGGGTPGTSTPTGPFSWNGASTKSQFDPKTLGTRMLQDVGSAYGQGPKVNPNSSFTPYSAQTSGLINTGLGDVNAMREGTVGDVAGGDWLGGHNPFFEQNLQSTRDNIMKDVGSTFTSAGRFGGGSFVDRAVDDIATSENAARSNNFENEYNRMLQANGLLQQGTAQGLGYSGLLDSKAAEKTAADNAQWDATNNAPFNHLSKYLGLMGSGNTTTNTNKPASFWDTLGTVGSTLLTLL